MSYPAFSPTGRAIAYETTYDHPQSDGTVSEIDVVNLQGRAALRNPIGGTSAGSLGEDTDQSFGGAIDWQPVSPGPPPAVDVGLVGGSPFRASRALTCSVAFSANGGLLATANTRGFGGPSCDPFGSGGGSVSVFSVERSGALRAVRGSPFSTGADLDTRSVAFDPVGRLLAVAVNRIVSSKRWIRPVGSGVMMFSVSRSGQLRKVPRTPFANARRAVAQALAFSPGGRLVAVVNETGTVSVFSVARSGRLEPVRGSPFRTGRTNPAGAIAFSPDGRFLVTSNTDATISVLAVSSRSGALAPVAGSPFRGGGVGAPLTFSPDGRLLAAAGGRLSLFSVDSATGSLASLPTPAISGFSPAAVAFNPAGTILAGASSGFGGVALFSIGADQSLTQIPGVPWMPDALFSTGADTPGPGAAFDGSGRLLALAEAGGGVSVLRVR